MLGHPLLAQGHGHSRGETPVTQLSIVGEILSGHLDVVPGSGSHSPEGEGSGFDGPHLQAEGGQVSGDGEVGRGSVLLHPK